MNGTEFHRACPREMPTKTLFRYGKYMRALSNFSSQHTITSCLRPLPKKKHLLNGKRKLRRSKSKILHVHSPAAQKL